MRNARLMFAASDHDANMLYATGMFVPDAFVWFEVAGKSYAVMSDLEIDRARRQARVDRVLPMSRYMAALKRDGVKQPRWSDVIRRVLAEYRVNAVEVPGSFPIGVAKRLRGVRVRVKPDPFFAERVVKSAAEVREIEVSLRLTEEGMRAGIDALRMCAIGRDGYLYRQRTRVTADDIRGVINATIAGLGGVAADTIVACGNQGCDPHEIGRGPLRAHRTIILDIFPRDVRTGYWGDMTRTVVRGRASEAVRKLYATVQRGQELAFGRLRDGVDGKEIHEAIQQMFRENGYPTRRHRGRMQGFFHGTGHGLGLDIHEAPRFGSVSEKLQAGSVVTVEPGLYYWGVGAVRLEDVALIQARGARNLTRYPQCLEI